MGSTLPNGASSAGRSGPSDPEDLHVDVASSALLGAFSVHFRCEQAIADPATGNERAAAASVYGPRNFENRKNQDPIRCPAGGIPG